MLKIFSGGLETVRGQHIDDIAQALSGDQPIAICLNVPIDDANGNQIITRLTYRLVGVDAPRFDPKADRIPLAPIHGRIGIWITLRPKHLAPSKTNNE